LPLLKVPTLVDELKRRIADSIMTVHADMLLRTWQELAYELHFLRPTKVSIMRCL